MIINESWESGTMESYIIQAQKVRTMREGILGRDLLGGVILVTKHAQDLSYYQLATPNDLLYRYYDTELSSVTPVKREFNDFHSIIVCAYN